MAFFTRKKIIISVIIVILVGLGIFICSTIHFSFFKYTYLKNEQDVLKENDNFYSLDNRENINIEEFSLSLKNGYYYIDPSYFEDSVQISDLSNETKLFLTYLFITGGKNDTCIEKKYFLKMMNYYFGINDIKWNLKKTSSGYDWFLHAFCFKSIPQTNQNDLLLENISENEESYILKYLVLLSDEQKQDEEINNKYFTVTFTKKNIPMLNKINVDFDFIEEIEVLK